MVGVEKESSGRLGYTRAMNSLVDWWLAQDPAVQLMITGNLPPDPAAFAEAVRLGIEYDEGIVDPRGFDDAREEVEGAETERRSTAAGKRSARAPRGRLEGRPNRGGGA
jgi:hypothetical protein